MKKAILKIIKAELLGDLSLKLTFSDGKVVDVAFKEFLQNSVHPEIRKYLKPSLFKKFQLIDGDLMWGDYDLIFPISDLYKNQISKKNARKKKAS